MADWMSKLTKDFGTIAGELKQDEDIAIPLDSPSLNWAIGNGELFQVKLLSYMVQKVPVNLLLVNWLLLHIRKLIQNQFKFYLMLSMLLIHHGLKN